MGVIGLENGKKRLDIRLGGGPTGGKSSGGMAFVQLLPEAEGDLSGKPMVGRMIQNRKDLIGGGSEQQGIALVDERFLNLLSVLHGGLTNMEIEIVGKQPVKLNTQQPAFCKQCPVLLDDRKEMGNQLRVGDHHGLAQQCAAFGAADIKRITEPRQIDMYPQYWTPSIGGIAI